MIFCLFQHLLVPGAGRSTINLFDVLMWIMTPLIINTPTQQAPYTRDRARCAASTAPNTRGGTRESTAACGRRPGPPRSCRCSRSGDRHCETGSRGTNRPRVRPAAPPQPPLGCAAFCTGSCTRDRASVQPIAVRAAATRPPRSQVGLDDLPQHDSVFFSARGNRFDVIDLAGAR